MARNSPKIHRAAGAVLLTAALAAAALALPGGLPGSLGEPRAAAAVERAPVGVRFALGGPRGIQIRRNRFVGATGANVDVYRRAGDNLARPAVLIVHGGGWSGGGKGRTVPVARAIARAGMVAVNLAYTLAAPGVAGYPRQPSELRAAVRWIRRNAVRLGVDRTRIGSFGSSAGGHLAALLATRGQGPLDRGTRVAAAAVWSAPLDLPALAGHRLLGPAATQLLGCAVQTCPERWADASPIAHVTPDDPPLLLVNSLREMVSADQSERTARRFAAAAVPHELWLLEGHAHAREYSHRALGRTVAFLRRELAP
jgi:acetyl esterase